MTLPAPMTQLPRIPVAEDGQDSFNMLEGIRVLDLTTSIAGPYGTMMLGDFGAEILKLERPNGGDDARHWGPPFHEGESLWYLSVNRNKKSIALDFTTEAGREVFEKLVASVDVVISNQIRRVQHKLGIDPESLHAIREDLIVVSLTGFGLTGERADDACYDLIAEGYAGIMDITGTPESEPQKIGAPAADMLAGQDAAMTVLAALFDRQRTGRGRVIDLSLVESMTRFTSCRFVPHMGGGKAPVRTGARDSVIAVYQQFETADFPITVGLGNDNIWARFWNAIGHADYLGRPEHANNAKRLELRPEIVADIQKILLTKDRAHWLPLLRAARVPCGPINTVPQALEDTEFHDRELFYVAEDGERSVPQVGLGIQIDGQANHPRLLPPRLGEHTDQILADTLGYDAAQLQALKDAGVI